MLFDHASEYLFGGFLSRYALARQFLCDFCQDGSFLKLIMGTRLQMAACKTQPTRFGAVISMMHGPAIHHLLLCSVLG